MRQLALDLPFEEVDSEVSHYGPEVLGKDLESLRGDDKNFLAKLESRNSVRAPWLASNYLGYDFYPTDAFLFTVWPGPGSESASIGLCKYPSTFEVQYTPEQDKRFKKTTKTKHSTRWGFHWTKWREWLEATGYARWLDPNDVRFREMRTVRTRQGSICSHSSFCKTQYASDPACGGVANFLRCHVSLITLLDRINELPGVEVSIEDEGHYGPSTHSDDWVEAREAGREPTYVWHPPTYSIDTLLRNLGGYNNMIAAFFGAMNNALAGTEFNLESPIADYANFEQLEFRGSRDAQIKPFLAAMTQIGNSMRIPEEEIA